MSTKVEQVSGMEHAIQAAVTSTSPAASTVSPKVSMFAKKSGFVIPKNKLSGSLVPIFRGSKKPGGSELESEETTKQVLRKTRWGPDLTQDASVRKGRALAYQTRVDQIMEQLKSGIMEGRYDQDSAVNGSDQESPGGHVSKKSELELERNEIIGEILKLNPSYKAPADYKPLLKEAKVPIPIKEYPGHNFIGLIFGPANDNQKRLEKETGTKIRVYGTKADTKKESELISSDGNEGHNGYEELHVLVTADTYEKVDTAVSLIELLVTPVSANTVSESKTAAVSGDNPDAVGLSQDTPASYTMSPVLVNQGMAQPYAGSGQAPPLGQFQPYPNQWLQAGQSSGFLAPPFPNSSAPFLRNPVQASPTSVSSSIMPPFGQRPVMSGGFGSVAHNTSLVSSQPQPILQRPHMTPNLGYIGPPRNPSFPPPSFSTPTFTPNPPTPTGPNPNLQPMRPHTSQNYTFPDRPLTTTGWSQAPAGSPGATGPTHMPHIRQPTVRPQSPLPMATISGGQPSPFRPSGSPSPVAGPQSGAHNPTLSSTSIPPPVRPPSITALKPQQPSSNDFTFQTNRAQTPFSQPPPRPGPQFHPPQSAHIQPPQSQMFRPGMTNHRPPPVMQGFSRPQNNHQMGQHQGQPTMRAAPPPRQPVFPGPGPGPGPRPSAAIHAPQMGPSRFGPAPTARPGNFGQPQQNYPSVGLQSQNPTFRGNATFSPGRPVSSNPSGPPQIYDPFSPTAVPPKSQTQNSRKQDNDPEYEDLMASVGVK